MKVQLVHSAIWLLIGKASVFNNWFGNSIFTERRRKNTSLSKRLSLVVYRLRRMHVEMLSGLDIINLFYYSGGIHIQKLLSYCVYPLRISDETTTCGDSCSGYKVQPNPVPVLSLVTVGGRH